MTGHVYAVASGKGGVGKTTTVANLGTMIHHADQSVVLVDSDLGMPNLANVLGIEPTVTIHDVLANEAPLSDALVETDIGFSVLLGERGLEGFAAADPTELTSVIDKLASEFDYVLVDTGAGLSYEALLPLGLVDETILVTTADESSTGDTARTAEFIDTVDGIIKGVVITRANTSTDPIQIADRLGIPLLGVIPDDPTVRNSTTVGEVLSTYDPDSKPAKAYEQLAAVLLENADPYLGDTDQEPDHSHEQELSREPDIDEPEIARDSDPVSEPEDEDFEEEPADETKPVEPDSESKPGLLGRITGVFKR